VQIGELAQRTEVSTRLLRYYEEQGLITPRRLHNGYREYDDYLVERVQKIRGLLDSGIPTRLIGSILPCLGEDIVVEDADPHLREVLVEQHARMAARITFLEESRDALARYIAAMDQATLPVTRSA